MCTKYCDNVGIGQSFMYIFWQRSEMEASPQTSKQMHTDMQTLSRTTHTYITPTYFYIYLASCKHIKVLARLSMNTDTKNKSQVSPKRWNASQKLTSFMASYFVPREGKRVKKENIMALACQQKDNTAPQVKALQPITIAIKFLFYWVKGALHCYCFVIVARLVYKLLFSLICVVIIIDIIKP